MTKEHTTSWHSLLDAEWDAKRREPVEGEVPGVAIRHGWPSYRDAGGWDEEEPVAEKEADSDV